MGKFVLPLVLLVGFALDPATPLKSDKTLGFPSAPIVLEVYSDFQCPSCKTFYEGTLQSLIQDYVNKGKVYLVHHDFPLAMHQYSREAACYADAAATLHKYEQVSAALFQRQTYWAANGKVDEVVAGVLSPEEMKKVRALVKDPQLNQALDREIAQGVQAGVKATPTLILTHRLRTYPIPPNASYPVMRRFLDDLLSK